MTYRIRPITEHDRPLVTHWAQAEDFCPGIYRGRGHLGSSWRTFVNISQ